MTVGRDRTGCHTECGRRPVNQDAVLAVVLTDGRELVAVADGMGGHSAGEVASQRALETLWTRLKTGVDLESAMSAANAEVHAAATDNPAWSGMGTTLVAMLRSGSTYHVANVGDSRAYRITPHSVNQITTDHSMMAEAMREGGITFDDIAPVRWRNALTRALGTDARVEVDIFGPFDAADPHALLLCSDGLHRSISEESLREHVGRADDPWAAARAVAAEAWHNGSSDNISVAVVLFRDDDIDHAPVIAAVEAPTPVRRRRRRSRRAKRVERLLVVTVLLLIVVVAVLVRAW